HWPCDVMPPVHPPGTDSHDFVPLTHAQPPLWASVGLPYTVLQTCPAGQSPLHSGKPMPPVQSMSGTRVVVVFPPATVVVVVLVVAAPVVVVVPNGFGTEHAQPPGGFCVSA